ncbi:MAG: LCP family protein [Armatimonadetes bacterium]|nr:LCP family protein [Armatimonadota bacterium]
MMEHQVADVSRRRIRRRRITGGPFWKAGLGLLFVLALISGAWVGRVYFGSPTVRQIVHDWRSGKLEPASAFPGKDGVTILVLGRDVDIDNHARVVRTNGRTDTILLVRLNFLEETANVLSIPRDTLARIPGYRGKRKINVAHALGGPELAVRTVERLLNVRPEEFVVVDYESFIRAIDLLGGLEVTVARQMDYDDNWGNLHIHLQPGNQVLNGEQALGYARFRKSNDGCSESDQERIERQQQLLMAAKRRLLSTSALVNLPEVVETIRCGISSSMSDRQVMAVAAFVRGLPADSIYTATLPGSTGRVYITADDDAARELVHKMF